ncbi:MAG: metallophosphoesterase [Tateyamaria sp.]|nr:metallophosphoesterase [Tateyamaria sp.]
MKLWAISDLHLASDANRQALLQMPNHGDDWLIIAGDIGEKLEHLQFALAHLTKMFTKVIWVPGNHDLWAVPEHQGAQPLVGQAKYNALVDCARSFNVLTPEDDYAIFPGTNIVLVPLFLLYDYSLRPAYVTLAKVIDWARAERSVCADETFLDPTPHASRVEWCANRLAYSLTRLKKLIPESQTVLINHWPLRNDLINIPRIPRFTPWCGTVETEDWHQQFNAKVVVSGHLHTRRTDWRNGTRFEEVSLGYPRQWDTDRGMTLYLRQIWPEV